jgi:hypothetical protein
MTVEHQVAGEDRRAISIARTLTELELGEVSEWEGSPSKYLLSTLKRWIALHGGESIQAEFALDATLSNTPDRYSSEDINPGRLYLTVDPASAGYIVIGPTLEITQANPSPVPSNVLRPSSRRCESMVARLRLQGCIGASGDVARMGRR